MSSSAAPSSLSRILIGSLIGAVIGLILLALGVAILWNAVDQRMANSASPPAPTSSLTPPKPTSEAAASPVPYPQVSPGKAAAPAAVEPEAPSRAATSVWRSIFDDEEERGAAPASEPAAAPTPAPGPAARPGPTRPAAPRASTPRRPPEAQRQDDSLFF
jgi:hypothetical protein